ncbi:hypothetical protein HW115_05255 [Verrucomicrobiaceae bacterium N1E253]|uniref:Uncharacterized protein n=1 Tax=Oceaniferula marina TaxID=2748318 RepID=A0A851GIH0_9BACT|nr:hypothetical protein [Oceaniferula marina]NWK55005.1 hypothetical protein [Oceaniferula marina]
MNNIGSIVLIFVCVGVGYILEPIFFSGSNQSPLKPAPEEASEPDADEANKPGDETVTPDPDPVVDPATEPADGGIQVDLSKLLPEDFPPKVTLKTPYTLSDEASGVTMQLKTGVKVKPLRIEEGLLVFQPVGFPIEGKTDVANTDFKELAVPLMLQRLQNALAQQEEADKVVVTPVPDPDPDPTPDPVPDPVPDPEPVVEPKAEPVADNGSSLDAAALVELMKASVAADKVTEFEADQVVSWKAGESMEFDGKVYQTGQVTFKAETILGMQEHDAIALIENGAVVKWMWAKTKLEMR